MTRIRLATYNVHKCRGMDWRVSPERILHIVREVEADIIALQEIFVSQAEYLAGELRMKLTFGPAREISNVSYGNAVLSRFAVTSSRNHDLKVIGREPRSCLETQLQIKHGEWIFFFAVHLGTSFFERRKQTLRLVAPEILGRPEVHGRRLLAGDMNEWTRGLATRILSCEMKSADTQMHLRRAKTYPGALPFLHLDHIYYDDTFHLTRMELHKTGRALLASDHLPLAADFELP